MRHRHSKSKGFVLTTTDSVVCCLHFPLYLTGLSVCPRLSVDQASPTHPKAVTIRQYLRQLSRHRNFIWFVSMNLIQVNFRSGFSIKILWHSSCSHVFWHPCTSLIWVLFVLLPLQVFHCHFNSNFFPLFLEHLLSDNISASTGSFLLGKWHEITSISSNNN